MYPQHDSTARANTVRHDNYEVGDRVEAIFKGKGSKWFGGTITRVNRDGTLDVRYDDGETETSATQDNVRKYAGDESNQRRSLRNQPIQEGAKVEARFRGKARYYPGVVRRVNRDGTFDISYDDGENETGVEGDYVRFTSDSRSTETTKNGRFDVGDNIEALYNGRGSKWFAGIISIANRDGSYDIRYADGERETNALETNIRRPETFRMEDPRNVKPHLHNMRDAVLKFTTNGPSLTNVFEEYDQNHAGEVSEDDFERILMKLGADLGRAELYRLIDEFPGRQRGKVSFVDFERALKLPSGRRDATHPYNQFQEVIHKGTKVEARYRGKSRFYPGVVSGVHDDGSYDIDYDDGERETFVEKQLVRLATQQMSLSQDGAEFQVTLIAAHVREQLWEWAKGYSKGIRTRDALRKVFKSIDKSETGAINRTDMASALQKKMKLLIAQRDLDVLLDCIDVDGTGRIGYEEFVDFCCYQPEG
jgi:Ca2+-binding EF-hand superfamily protein